MSAKHNAKRLENTRDPCAAGQATSNYDAPDATNCNVGRGCNRLKPLTQDHFEFQRHRALHNTEQF
jgi:hypothetical protein